MDPFETSSTEAFCEIVPYISGPNIITDGMCSGEGYSIYMEERSVVEAAVGKIKGLASMIDQEFNQR